MFDCTPDEVPVYYTNAAQLRTSVFDVQLRFQVQTEVSIDADQSPVCLVVMTPEYARVFAQTLTQVLIEYEANCGAIRAPRAPQREGWQEWKEERG